MSDESTRAPEPEVPRAKRPKKRRSLGFRIARGVAIALFVPLALVAVVVLYLHTSSGKARVRALIVEKVGEKMNGSIRIEGLDYALGGHVALRGVKLSDTSGAEVVSVGSLEVVPSWSDLLHGRIEIAAISIDAVRVHLVKDADGGSNLKRLFKPQPEPAEPKKPLDKKISIRMLHVGDVGVAIDQPDGTKLTLSHLGLDGSIAIVPASKTFDVEISKIGASLDLDKGPDALKLAISDLATGLSVHVAGGGGKVTLHPVSGHVALTLPGKERREFDLGLGATSFDVHEGSLDASIGSLLTGIVALGSVEVRGGVADGKLSGAQKADVVGLHVDAAKVNELLGKELLASDVDVEAHVAGPPDAIALDSRITTNGGKVGLKGTVGVADPANPSYDLSLSVDDVSTDKLLAPGILPTPVEVGHVSLDVKGHGKELGAVATDAKLHVERFKTRGVPVDDVALDARIEGGVVTVRSLDVKAVGQEVKVSGTYGIAKKDVDLSVAVEGDVGDALARLKAAGLPIHANVPKGLVRLRPGDMTVKVKGDLAGALEANVEAPHLAFAGGTIGLAAHASLLRHDPPPADGKKVEILGLDAHVSVAGLRLSSLAALRGKKLPGIDGTIGGTIDVKGTPTDPRATIDLGVRAQRDDGGGSPLAIGLRGEVDASHAALTLSGRRGEADLLHGDVRLPLHLAGDPKGIDPAGRVSIALSIPKTRFSDLTALLPPKLLEGKTIPEGDLALDLHLAGTPLRPSGTLDLDVHAKALPAPIEQRLHLTGKLDPDGAGARVATETHVWLDDQADALLDASLDAALARSPLTPGPKSVGWHAVLDMKPKALASLPLPNDRGKAVGGTVALHGDFEGTLDDAKGLLTLGAHDLRPGGKGPIDADLSIGLDEAAAKIALGVDLAKSRLLGVDGKIGVAGKGLVAKLRAKQVLDPSVDVSLDIPKRALASLATVSPALATIPGDLSGHVEVHGTKSAPVGRGTLVVDGFKALSGDAGKVALSLDADRDELAVGLGIGADGPGPRIAIEGHVPRAGLAELSKPDGKLPIAATMRAKSVDLKTLLPSFALDKVKGLGVQGRLDWDMDFGANVTRNEAGATKLENPTLTGSFALEKGQIDLPHTKRTYRDVELKITAAADALRIDAGRATERDLQVQDRSIVISGALAWHDLKPTKVDLDVAANKWLVFGTKLLGQADAPRGTLSLDAHASAELDQPIKQAKIDVKKLELLIPDRFEKAHQPEDVHVGDLVFLGETPNGTGGTVALGKLPIGAGTLEKIEQEKAASEKANEPPPPPGAAPPPETGLDLDIKIAKGAHVMQSPIDLWPRGELHIERRAAGRKITGRLDIDKGELSLGGAFHALAKGSITFDEKNPGGFLDLSFEKPLKPSALRGVAGVGTGDKIRIHMFGPLSDRKTVLAGAGSPGALYDLLAMHNEGRERFFTEPDMPISNTVEFPQHENLLILSFISVNLPHLLFLDRVTAWADPYDAQASYGKLQHYQAERYTSNGKVRVMTSTRPPTVGRSEAEVELDYLFANTPQTLFGVGVAAGSRGGGGPGVFFEWSSPD